MMTPRILLGAGAGIVSRKLSSTRLRVNNHPVVRRLDAIRYDPPAWSLKQALVVLLVVLAVAWLWSWHVRSGRDAWWRASIAESSAAVREAISSGTRDAEATDAEIIKSLENVDARLIQAEKMLARKPTGLADNRCSLPADCFGGLFKK